MSNILDKIVANKRRIVQERKQLYPEKLLEQSPYYQTVPLSLKEYLKRPDKQGIIAEIKRKAPSSGELKAYIDIERLSVGYMQAGASALSILTDQDFFGGTNEDLQIARKNNLCPILRKDFIIDEYQIVEAKAIGADAILLIASILSKEEVSRLSHYAHNFALEVVFEIHSEEELDKISMKGVDIIGVNNRDLNDFSINFETSMDLFAKLPKEYVKISESGIKTPQDMLELKKIGYEGFLIGTEFMRHSNPELACKDFINQLKDAQG